MTDGTPSPKFARTRSLVDVAEGDHFYTVGTDGKVHRRRVRFISALPSDPDTKLIHADGRTFDPWYCFASEEHAVRAARQEAEMDAARHRERLQAANALLSNLGAGWSVCTHRTREGASGSDPVCSMAWWQFDVPGVIDDGISGANARLIAASPDLLVALKNLMDIQDSTDDCWCDDDEPVRPCEACAARAAIAKATVESS